MVLKMPPDGILSEEDIHFKIMMLYTRHHVSGVATCCDVAQFLCCSIVAFGTCGDNSICPAPYLHTISGECFLVQ